MNLSKNIRFVLTLLVPIWTGALVEHYMPDRWENRPTSPTPTTWWAIPYLATQLVGVGCTVARLNSISEEKDHQ